MMGFGKVGLLVGFGDEVFGEPVPLPPLPGGVAPSEDATWMRISPSKTASAGV